MSWLPSSSSSPNIRMRLVKLRSDVLPERARVAVIDHRTDGVAIGRDRSYTPRIRIPSMEVSKHHACISVFPDGRFGISDTGSTHGTFVAKRGSSHFQRLSEPKRASVPISLCHLDVIRLGMGANEFEVHIHDTSTGWCCDACSLDGQGESEISFEEKRKEALLAHDERLHPETQQQAAIAALQHGFGSGYGDRKLESEFVRRQKMNQLKSRHLSDDAAIDKEASMNHIPSSCNTNRAVQHKARPYVDRAAQRRELVGKSQSEESRRRAQDAASQTEFLSSTHAAPAATKRTTAEEPIRADNRGYQMYSNMVQQQQADATTSRHIRERIIVARGVEGRAGLGSKRMLQIDEMADRAGQKQLGRGQRDPEHLRERQRRRYEDSLARGT